MNERLYLGVEIGGTKLQVVLGNYHAEILDRFRFTVDPARGGAGIRDQIARAVTEILRKHRLTAVGIGFGGPVDWRTGKIACSHQVAGWSDFALAHWMRHLTGTPVWVDNDANTACLAEALRGAGKEFDPVFYVTLGSGVGGGLVTGGAIYHGALPGESEIGHIRLDKSGRIVEQSCSGWAVDRKIREQIKSCPNSALARLAQGQSSGEARFLGLALAENDDLAKQILEETAEDLAFALSHVTHLVHPQIIVLGGGLSLLGEVLRKAVERHLNGFLMEAFKPAPKISLAALGENVVPIGALLLAKSLDSR